MAGVHVSALRGYDTRRPRRKELQHGPFPHAEHGGMDAYDRYIDVDQGLWPDPARRGEGNAPWKDAQDWSLTVRLARKQALVETSSAFTAGGTDVDVICGELADRTARLLGATCLIRPLDNGKSDSPTVLAQRHNSAHRGLAELVAGEPHALAAACSTRAAEMRCRFSSRRCRPSAYGYGRRRSRGQYLRI